MKINSPFGRDLFFLKGLFFACSQIISFFELRYNVFAKRGEGLFSFYYKGILVIFD